MGGIESGEVDSGAAQARYRNDAEDLGRELVRLHQELRAHALFLTQRSAAADDLVQDVVERALSARHRFQWGTNLKAWLNAIMKNLFIDAYRQRHGRLDHDLVQSEVSAGGEPRSPLDLITMDDVRDALALLGPSDREIFTLAYLDRLSYREISTRLGIPMNTAGTRLLRVRNKLRRLLTRVYDVRSGAAGPTCSQS